MIKTVFDVDVPAVPSAFAHGSTSDHAFTTAYSAWMEEEHVKYLYANGEIDTTEIDELTDSLGNRYTVSWKLSRDKQIWFVLKWGNHPGVIVT